MELITMFGSLITISLMWIILTGMLGWQTRWSLFPCLLVAATILFIFFHVMSL